MIRRNRYMRIIIFLIIYIFLKKVIYCVKSGVLPHMLAQKREKKI